jgi:hypothetical protein
MRMGSPLQEVVAPRRDPAGAARGVAHVPCRTYVRGRSRGRSSAGQHPQRRACRVVSAHAVHPRARRGRRGAQERAGHARRVRVGTERGRATSWRSVSAPPVMSPPTRFAFPAAKSPGSSRASRRCGREARCEALQLGEDRVTRELSPSGAPRRPGRARRPRPARCRRRAVTGRRPPAARRARRDAPACGPTLLAASDAATSGTCRRDAASRHGAPSAPSTARRRARRGRP